MSIIDVCLAADIGRKMRFDLARPSARIGPDFSLLPFWKRYPLACLQTNLFFADISLFAPCHLSDSLLWNLVSLVLQEKHPPQRV
jgi:hypothetical protein